MEEKIKARIGELLAAVDGKFADSWKKLNYEEIVWDSVRGSDNESDDESNSELNNGTEKDNYHFYLKFQKKGAIRKLQVLSKLNCVKWMQVEDEFIRFKIVIPKEGDYLISEDGKLNLKNCEHDSSKEAWEFYYKRYGKKLKDKKIKISEETFPVHGEVDFNFGIDKIEDFRYIVEHDTSTKASDEQKAIVKDLLNVCAYYNYSLLNFSVIPSVGNLQATKGTIGADRFDVFIWALDQYYRGESDLIINSHTTVQTMEKLTAMLDCFPEYDAHGRYSYDSFFRFFYELDEDILSKLVESGKKRIDTTDRVIEYILLAYTVWKQRFDLFDHSGAREIYYQLGGENVQVAFRPHLKKLEELGYHIEW